jgi:VanZ family protein
MTALLRLNARLWPWATLGLLAAVTLLSLWPRPELQAAAPGGDKLHHLLAYAALAAPVALARPRGWAWALAGLAAWSWGIELVQPLVGRHNSLADLAANVAGLGLGAAAAAGLRRAAGR